MNSRYIHALALAPQIGFLPEQIEELAPSMELILEKAEEGIVRLEEALAKNEDTPAQVTELTQSVGLEKDLGMLAVSMLLTEKSRALFKERGIPENIFVDSMKNIRIWMNTCISDRGHLGMYEYGWIANNLRGGVLRLGRFEFHVIPFNRAEEWSANGVTVRNGDPVINVHIPADGHMEPTEMEESFRLAYQYYGVGKITPFVCDSWLLYPGNKLFCKPESRMVTFLNYFHILEYRDSPNSSELKRVFGEHEKYDDPTTFREDTPLQRSLKAHLLNGGTIGNGFGILLHDGEKRLPLN